MHSSLKSKIRSNPVFNYCWTRFRSYQLHWNYNRRRKHYEKLARMQALFYRENDIISLVRERMRSRYYAPFQRKKGEVHTFACIPQFGWHRHLLPDLEQLGYVSLFDYISEGYPADLFYGGPKWSKYRIEQRRQMVERLLPAFRAAHAKHPVDWVLCYGGGQDISASAIRQITEEFGVPTVNMTFDDKQGWAGPNVGEHCTGARDITPFFDLFMTSSRVSCEWHMVEGGRALYMPEGFDLAGYYPMNMNKDIPISFVGNRYGYRDSVVRYLKKHGVPIRAFGQGWDSGWINDTAEIFNRSMINLGMGGIGYSESLTNLKGRDFEIPGTGGGVYLTTFNPDLARHFVIGKEILCYRDRKEMLKLIRYYLSNPDEAGEIARRGYERCLREHRWLYRYQKALQILGVLRDNAESVEV